MGIFGFLKSKESLDKQAQYLEKKISAERIKTQANNLRNEAWLRVRAKQNELKQMRSGNTTPEIRTFKNNIIKGAGVVGNTLLNTGKAISQGAMQASKNYSKNMQKHDNLLNQVLGIKPMQPKPQQMSFGGNMKKKKKKHQPQFILRY